MGAKMNNPLTATDLDSFLHRLGEQQEGTLSIWGFGLPVAGRAGHLLRS